MEALERNAEEEQQRRIHKDNEAAQAHFNSIMCAIRQFLVDFARGQPLLEIKDERGTFVYPLVRPKGFGMGNLNEKQETEMREFLDQRGWTFVGTKSYHVNVELAPIVETREWMYADWSMFGGRPSNKLFSCEYRRFIFLKMKEEEEKEKA